jgi:hypothetical protein
MMTMPQGLSAGGRALWTAVDDEHDLDAMQLVQLEEACRAKDRLDKLDDVLRGDGHTWMELVEDFNSDQISELRITNALVQANATANLMKQLLAALRLPDAQTGKKPQYRGPRGAQKPSVPAGVSSLERARAAKTGS